MRLHVRLDTEALIGHRYGERNDRMSKLAVNGGKPLRDVKANPWPKWPFWDENEEKGLLEVL